MKLAGKHVVVTGGGSGIGAAMCRRFAAEGARGVVIADRDGTAASAVAREIGAVALAVTCDVARDEAIVALVERAIATHGPIDLFCSNAGIAVMGGFETPDAEWQRTWDVNVMAHVRAARAVLPAMLARGEGCLLSTASAAGLLTALGAAPYAVSKHAAVAFAEWLAITYGDSGVRFSCVCPQAVRTQMTFGGEKSAAARAVQAAGATLEPEAVVDAIVAGLEEERFLILPHPEVATYERNRATDRARWLSGMRALRAKVFG